MITVLAALRWLAATRSGRGVAMVGGVLFAFFLARSSGRRAANREHERDMLKDYADTRQRGDEALRRAEGDTRPADDRLAEHGALRDE